MKIQTTPYLTFPGTCEEAFTFYAQLFGGKTEAMMPHAGTPAEAHAPADWKNKILHARLSFSGQTLMASDSPPGHYQKPQGIAVSIGLTDPAEADRIYAALSQNSPLIIVPLGPTFWAKKFAMFTDRFGIPWMINCE